MPVKKKIAEEEILFVMNNNSCTREEAIHHIDMN